MSKPAPRRALPQPRRANALRRPIAKGVSAALVTALASGLGVYGFSQATSASATAPTPVTLTPLVVAPTPVKAVTDGYALASAEVVARQDALETVRKEISAEAARLDSLGRFFFPAVGAIGSPFGMRFHPILHIWRLHDGVDIGADCNSPIWASLSGTVIEAQRGSSSGNYVKIDHGIVNGHKLVSAYLHMNKILVKKGDVVARGQQIGLVGSTGLSTSCHLHLAVYQDGKGTDPARFLTKG